MVQYDEKMAWLNDGLKVSLSILSVIDLIFHGEVMPWDDSPNPDTSRIRSCQRDMIIQGDVQVPKNPPLK